MRKLKLIVDNAQAPVRNENIEVMTLRAIESVRREMVRAHASGADNLVMFEILGRLVNLYGCLNVSQLLAMLEAEKSERKAA